MEHFVLCHTCGHLLVRLSICTEKVVVFFYLYINSKNLRAIPEAEIGLAVIFMSTEKYCNPQKQPASKGNWKKGSNSLKEAVSLFV